MKRALPDSTSATVAAVAKRANDVKESIKELRVAFNRQTRFISSADRTPCISTQFELHVRDNTLCLVCNCKGLEGPPKRLLFSQPLTPLYKKWHKRQGRSDDACYCYVYDSRSKTITGGPPADHKRLRYIEFRLASFLLRAWFEATAVPEERNYIIKFKDGHKMAWQDPETGCEINEVSIQFSQHMSTYDMGIYSRLLNALNLYQRGLEKKAELLRAIESYPAFVAK